MRLENMAGEFCAKIFRHTSTVNFSPKLVIFLGALFVPNIANAKISAHADQSEYGGGYLNDQINGISECHIGGSKEAPHIIATVRRAEVGEAIQFQVNDDMVFKYVFGDRPSAKGKWVTERKQLERAGVIDIPIATAKAFVSPNPKRGHGKPVKLFTKTGTYLLFLGYSFDAGDEAQIGGVCEINYQP